MKILIKKVFNNTLKCKYCDCEFNHLYNDRCIILNEIVDKEKLKYILDNNNFTQEVTNIAKNYYNSLDEFGRKRVVYKQKHKHKDRYYAVGSALTYLKKEIRNSIVPKNLKDIDMINCHPVILLNLCEKNNLKCNILKDYVENRDLILETFGDDRKVIKEIFLSILNGGFKNIYSNDDRIHNYLKSFEFEILEIQKLFSIKYNQLSEFQRKNLKENYISSEKLINHLGSDKDQYISFEMYEMMKFLGYKINIKGILEYKHENFMKPYIDFLFEKKSYYKSIGNISMSV